jgi:signal transduction histidine kinase/CheY-like chemotaxis protein
LVGQNLFELYKDHPAIPSYLRRALSGESFWYTVEVRGAVYDTWVTPLTDGGRVTGIVGVSNDVTHLRQLQANVIQNDRVIAMGTLAASVAHEINNPLTYMLGHLDLLSDCLVRLGQSTHDVAASAETQQTAVISTMRESLDLVRAGTRQIASITQELRTFSRPAVQTSRVDVNAAVISVLKLVGKELESRARVEVDLADSPPARADMAQLVQVILNLVINAMQALPADHAHTSHIWISTAGQGDQVVIEVADNGPGVPPEDRDRVFEPFLTRKGVGEGSGLGLFVCRNIVNAWGGTVSVDERPGGGACFQVVLPADAGTAPARSESEPLREPVQSAGPLLIIDDDPAVAAILVKQLERAGFRVLLEADADRGLGRLLSGQHGIELVYCDLMMKGTSGMDLAERLAVEAPAMLGRVVFMTGGAFTPRARDFRSAHADQCVDKPFDIVAETARRLAERRA